MIKLDKKQSNDFWKITPTVSHDGNLFTRHLEQNCIHQLIKYYKPKTCVEFGYNVGHSAVTILDALESTSKLYSFDIKNTNGNLLNKIYDNFTFIEGDSVEQFNNSGIEDVDFVLIDSLHTYKQVSRELEAIYPKLKKGAILYFDDTNNVRDGSGNLTIIGPPHKAILDFEYYNSLEEISDWISPTHMKSPFCDLNGNWFRPKVIRIYKKIK